MERSVCVLLSGAREAEGRHSRTLSRRALATGAHVDVTLVQMGPGALPLPVITAFSADGQTIRDLRPLHYQDPQRLAPALAVRLPGEVARRSMFLRVDDGALLRVELVQTRDREHLVAIFGTEQLDVDEFTRVAPRGAGGVPSAVVDTLERIRLERASRRASRSSHTTASSGSAHSSRAASADSHCMICFERTLPGSTLLQMPCAHRYHEPCLRRWLLLSNSCPLCRAPLPLATSSANAHVLAHAQANTLHQPQHRQQLHHHYQQHHYTSAVAATAATATASTTTTATASSTATALEHSLALAPAADGGHAAAGAARRPNGSDGPRWLRGLCCIPLRAPQPPLST